MTDEEALRKFKAFIDDGPLKPMLFADNAIKALEKQIEQEPVSNPGDDFNDGYFSCPVCDEYLDLKDEYDYCPDCGQALNWKRFVDEVYGPEGWWNEK